MLLVARAILCAQCVFETRIVCFVCRYVAVAGVCVFVCVIVCVLIVLFIYLLLDVLIVLVVS